MGKKIIDKNIENMSIFELNQLKDIVVNIADEYSNQLIKYYGVDFNTYLNTMNEHDKSLLEKRLKYRKFYEKICKLIEDKVDIYVE
jgi:hypothetical protein